MAVAMLGVCVCVRKGGGCGRGQQETIQVINQLHYSGVTAASGAGCLRIPPTPTADTILPHPRLILPTLPQLPSPNVCTNNIRLGSRFQSSLEAHGRWIKKGSRHRKENTILHISRTNAEWAGLEEARAVGTTDSRFACFGNFLRDREFTQGGKEIGNGSDSFVFASNDSGRMIP